MEEKKEFSNIIMMYADHVVRDKRKIDSVPTALRDEVKACIVFTVGEELAEIVFNR